MSATKRSGSPSPIVRIKTSIVTFAVREDGSESIINCTEVSYKDVEQLTGLQSDFLEEMVQRPNLGKRSSPSGPPSIQRRPSPRASPIPPAPAPAPVPSPVIRVNPQHVFRIGLTGGTFARTTDPGAQRPHGGRQIMGFVELNLVNGNYEGHTRYRSSHSEYQLELVPASILETDNNVLIKRD